MTAVGRKVRKTLNIDAEKLRRVQQYLGLETETEAIDHVLDDYDFERELSGLLKKAVKSWKTFRSPLVVRPPRR